MWYNDKIYWKHRKVNATNVWFNVVTKSIYYVLYPSSDIESFKYAINQEIEHSKKLLT